MTNLCRGLRWRVKVVRDVLRNSRVGMFCSIPLPWEVVDGRFKLDAIAGCKKRD